MENRAVLKHKTSCKPIFNKHSNVLIQNETDWKELNEFFNKIGTEIFNTRFYSTKLLWKSNASTKRVFNKKLFNISWVSFSCFLIIILLNHIHFLHYRKSTVKIKHDSLSGSSYSMIIEYTKITWVLKIRVKEYLFYAYYLEQSVLYKWKWNKCNKLSSIFSVHSKVFCKKSPCTMKAVMYH